MPAAGSSRRTFIKQWALSPLLRRAAVRRLKPGIQAARAEEADAGRGAVSEQPEGKRSLRHLSLFHLSEELRRG
jgi:hypothetical protein